MPTCTVVIKDEVNIKLENLSLEARRALVNAFKYQVPYARHLPSVRLGRWDGKVAYVQLGGSTYVNLLPDIIPILEKFNYDIELDDRRTYSTVFEFDIVQANTYSHCTWPEGHVSAGQPITLRDYQIEVINNFLNNPQCIQEVATGAGKCLAGDTMLTIKVDETTPFGKFLLNKLQQEQENEVTRNNCKV
jgi:hypothetical protein